ncbi:hypothetical protein IE81DRAFT_258093 [Ceraceosorus guamensis]|uniref:Uncharacterized protein n=1 Tax=Ceraceosorus guamensis TaxID=1522189 RepID=A0A316VWF5_9BASI|nr:hypothetical protein IE81DRAFT_258093 [Ceraceosorus guamensis]PWN39785.1 hypothetical protein IE81DRAFT_258093 [Ceraceosorus guamensis]
MREARERAMTLPHVLSHAGTSGLRRWSYAETRGFKEDAQAKSRNDEGFGRGTGTEHDTLSVIQTANTRQVILSQSSNTRRSSVVRSSQLERRLVKAKLPFWQTSKFKDARNALAFVGVGGGVYYAQRKTHFITNWHNKFKNWRSKGKEEDSKKTDGKEQPAKTDGKESPPKADPGQPTTPTAPASAPATPQTQTGGGASVPTDAGTTSLNRDPAAVQRRSLLSSTDLEPRGIGNFMAAGVGLGIGLLGVKYFTGGFSSKHPKEAKDFAVHRDPASLPGADKLTPKDVTSTQNTKPSEEAHADKVEQAETKTKDAPLPEKKTDESHPAKDVVPTTTPPAAASPEKKEEVAPPAKEPAPPVAASTAHNPDGSLVYPAVVDEHHHAHHLRESEMLQQRAVAGKTRLERRTPIRLGFPNWFEKWAPYFTGISTGAATTMLMRQHRKKPSQVKPELIKGDFLPNLGKGRKNSGRRSLQEDLLGASLVDLDV